MVKLTSAQNDKAKTLSAPTRDTLSVLIVDAHPNMHAHYDVIFYQAGFKLIGPARCSKAAYEILRTQTPDAAILDISDSDDGIWALADTLRAQGIGFVLTSDTPLDPEKTPAAYRQTVCLTKPMTREQILMGLRLLCEA